MSKKIIINYCNECKYCEHNGMLQSNPLYLCHHKSLYMSHLMKGKKDNIINNIPYWYGLPIIDKMKKNENRPQVLEIPKWCPLEDN